MKKLLLTVLCLFALTAASGCNVEDPNNTMAINKGYVSDRLPGISRP